MALLLTGGVVMAVCAIGYLVVRVIVGGRAPACRTCGAVGRPLAEGLCSECWARMRAHRPARKVQ